MNILTLIYSIRMTANMPIIDFGQPLVLFTLVFVILPLIFWLLRKRTSVQIPWAAGAFLVAALEKTKRKRNRYVLTGTVLQTLILTCAIIAVAGLSFPRAGYKLSSILNNDSTAKQIYILDITPSMNVNITIGEHAVSRRDRQLKWVRDNVQNQSTKYPSQTLEYQLVLIGTEEIADENTEAIAEESTDVIPSGPTTPSMDRTTFLAVLEKLEENPDRVVTPGTIPQILQPLADAARQGLIPADVWVVSDFNTGQWKDLFADPRWTLALRQQTRFVHCRWIDASLQALFTDGTTIEPPENWAVTNLTSQQPLATVGRATELTCTVEHFCAADEPGQSALPAVEWYLDGRKIDRTELKPESAAENSGQTPRRWTSVCRKTFDLPGQYTFTAKITSPNDVLNRDVQPLDVLSLDDQRSLRLPVKKDLDVAMLQSIEDSDAHSDPVFIRSALNQTGYPVCFTCVNVQNTVASEVFLQNNYEADILIVDRIEPRPAWLVSLIARRLAERRPVWLLGAGSNDSQENQDSSNRNDTAIRLRETLNPSGPLGGWLDSLSIEFPSWEHQREDQPAGNETSETDIKGQVFTDNPMVVFDGSLLRCATDFHGINNAWPLSTFWVPFIDKLVDVSLREHLKHLQQSDQHSDQHSDQPSDFQSIPVFESDFGFCSQAGDWVTGSVTDTMAVGSGSPETTFSLVAAVLATAGLVMLIVLYRNYGRRSSEFSTRSRWIGLAITSVAGVILVLMIVQVHWYPKEQVKPVFLVLVDDSMSMQLPSDNSSDNMSDPGKTTVSRGEQVRRRLAESNIVWTTVFDSYSVCCSAFSTPEQITTINTPAELDRFWRELKFDGTTSNPGTATVKALDRVSRQTGEMSIGHVLIVTDGQSDDPDPLSAYLTRWLDGAKNRQISFSFLGTGTPEPTPDLRITNLAAETVWMAGQPYTVDVATEITGEMCKSVTAVLEVRDKKDEHNTKDEHIVIVSKKQVLPTEPSTSVSFPLSLDQPGEYKISVHVKADFPSGEFYTDNNDAHRTVSVTDQPIRVLLVSDGPCWEFRCLRNFFSRQKIVSLATVLQNASTEYIREDKHALAAFPGTTDELTAYDVLILVNPNPNPLTDAQHKVLQTVLSGDLINDEDNNDAGDNNTVKSPAVFLVLGSGYKYSQIRYSYWNELIGAETSSVPNSKGKQYRLELTPLGQSQRHLSELFVSTPDRELDLLDHVLICEPQSSGVRVLAEAVSSDGTGREPLITARTIGSAEVITLMSDSFWRWRSGDNEPFYGRFWLQLLRNAVHVDLNIETAGNQNEWTCMDLPHEFNRSAADFTALSNAAEAVGGKFLTLANPATKSDGEEERLFWSRLTQPTQLRTVEYSPVPLWNQPWLLAVLLLLLATDWFRLIVLRR